MLIQEIKQLAKDIHGHVIEMRRHLHAHPELSFQEYETSSFVKARLDEMNISWEPVAGTGIVALIKGEKLSNQVIALRADMDALPIKEINRVDYVSQNSGVMHACGHDVHTSSLLGTARILQSIKNKFGGTIKLIFQPGEEKFPGGASLMIKEGALENPRPQAIFGLHTAGFEVGQIGYQSGPAMASSDKFTITIHGKKSHGAVPQGGIDAVVVAAECVTALQTIRSRRIDPLEPLVLTIGTINGGVRNNIIADEVKMEGTMRTLNEQVRARAKELMRQTLASVTSAYDAKFDLSFDDSNPVTYNDPRLVDETLPTIRHLVGDANLLSLKPFMPAEDFSYYQKVIPGFFYFLGVGNSEKGVTAMIHTPEFDIDEESLVVGVKLMSNALLDYLDRAAVNK